MRAVRALHLLALALLVGAGALGLARTADAATAPVTWCGTDEVSANRLPNLQVSSARQIRVVYAIPSDGVDNFAQDASSIASDVSAIDGWWRGQDPSRTPRFDLYPFPGCTTTFGGLDLGFVRLPRPGSDYIDPAGVRLQLLAIDLGVSTSSSVKTLAYYDGPITDSQVCGTSFTGPQSGGPLGSSFVFLQADCYADLGLGGGLARVTRTRADPRPRSRLARRAERVPAALGGHVCDTSSDIMYPYTYDGETLDTAVLDVGRDDYYGHSGVWWDVQDSPWLARLPQFSLAATARGAREGRRRSGTPRPAAPGARRPSTTVSPCGSWRDRPSARSSCAGEGPAPGRARAGSR